MKNVSKMMSFSLLLLCVEYVFISESLCISGTTPNNINTLIFGDYISVGIFNNKPAYIKTGIFYTTSQCSIEQNMALFDWNNNVYIANTLQPSNQGLSNIILTCNDGVISDPKECTSWTLPNDNNPFTTIIISDNECPKSLCNNVKWNWNPAISNTICDGIYEYIDGNIPNLYRKMNTGPDNNINPYTYLIWKYDTQKWYCSNDENVIGCGPFGLNSVEVTSPVMWNNMFIPGNIVNIQFEYYLPGPTPVQGNVDLECIGTRTPTMTPTNPTTNTPTNIPTRITEIPTKETIIPTRVTDTPSKATFNPTDNTPFPSETPTINPSMIPTITPTFIPTSLPTNVPSINPSKTPTNTPTKNTQLPTQITNIPTKLTNNPTKLTVNPTRNTNIPTTLPTNNPTTFPSVTPSVLPTDLPTKSPTAIPTSLPTINPSVAPTHFPTNNPTTFPSLSPSISPTNVPTNTPTEFPTSNPSHTPSNYPSTSPTDTPTDVPTILPSNSPSIRTPNPSVSPSITPTNNPSNLPSITPTKNPTLLVPNPTDNPTKSPSLSPIIAPTITPSLNPSVSDSPSETPTTIPTLSTNVPTIATNNPSIIPTLSPSVVTTNATLTNMPTNNPSKAPTKSPSHFPTKGPSSAIFNATFKPTNNPTLSPTVSPTNATTLPSISPTIEPTISPSHEPTTEPTNIATNIKTTSSPKSDISVNFTWITSQYSECNTFNKARINNECFMNNRASLSRIKLTNIFETNKNIDISTFNIEWILIDPIKNIRYTLNDYDNVSILNTKFMDNNGITIIESTLIINTLYTKHNGYCIDMNFLSQWIVQPNQIYGFQLNITSYKSDIIYLKTRSLPPTPQCNIEINTNNPTIFDEFYISCNNITSDISFNYNILSNNILWSNAFVSGVTSLRGTISTGNITYIVIIQDEYESRSCYEITHIWPDITTILENTTITDIISNIVSILNTTNNIETVNTVINVVKELYFNNITSINETSSIVSNVVSNIGELIESVNNMTINEQTNELTNEVTIIRDITNTSELITQETGKMILTNIVDNVFNKVSNLVNLAINDTIETNPIIMGTIDTIVNIDKIPTEIDVDLQEYTNNLFGRGASIALKNRQIGEDFQYKRTDINSDNTKYEVSISSTKVGRRSLNLNGNILRDINTEPSKCVTFGINNREYSLTFPDTFFDDNNANTYDCTITQTNKDTYKSPENTTNYGASNIVIANIFEEDNIIEYDTDLCIPYLIEITLNSDDILQDNINSLTKDNNIFYPNCTFWNSTLNSFDNNNCYVYNYTNNSVICGCNHLTTFKVVISDIIPRVNRLNSWHFKNITMDNLIKYPTVSIAILSCALLSIILCIFNPRSKNGNDKPSLAYEDIIIKEFKNKKFKHEQYAYEIDLLNKYIPNANKLGNGLIPLIKYDTNNINNLDYIDKYPKYNVCYLQFRLFRLYLGNDHTLLSMFQRTEGTNFSTRQRISCWFMYLCTIMMSNAIFYGIEQPLFGGITASFISSLISTIPVFIVRYIFKSSKPRIIKRNIKLNDNIIDNKLTLNNKRSLNRKDYIDDLKKIHKKKDYTKIKYARNIIKKVIKNGNIKERFELVNEFRMIIFNQIYEFPHYFKYIAIILMIIWTLCCILLAIVYGLSFDILYPYRPEQYFPVSLYNSVNNNPIISDDYLSLNCSNNIVGYNIQTELSNKYADNMDSLANEYTNKFDHFGTDIGDTTSWLITLLISLVLSIFIWQPITIYILTWIKLWSFSLNLSLNTNPRTMKRLCRKVCCCCFIRTKNASNNIGSSNYKTVRSDSNASTPTPSLTNNISNSQTGTPLPGIVTFDVQSFPSLPLKSSNINNINSNDTNNNSNNDNNSNSDDEFKWFDGSLFTLRSTLRHIGSNNPNKKRKKGKIKGKGRYSRRGVVVTENRPMDILSFFSHDILFIEKYKIAKNDDNNSNNNPNSFSRHLQIAFQNQLTFQNNNSNDNNKTDTKYDDSNDTNDDDIEMITLNDIDNVTYL